MANNRTGPDYLDQKSTNKRAPSNKHKTSQGMKGWQPKQYDPEVLKKYPHNPVETIGVSIMRDKMQKEIDKKKTKSK